MPPDTRPGMTPFSRECRRHAARAEAHFRCGEQTVGTGSAAFPDRVRCPGVSLSPLRLCRRHAGWSGAGTPAALWPASCVPRLRRLWRVDLLVHQRLHLLLEVPGRDCRAIRRRLEILCASLLAALSAASCYASACRRIAARLFRTTRIFLCLSAERPAAFPRSALHGERLGHRAGS